MLLIYYCGRTYLCIQYERKKIKIAKCYFILSEIKSRQFSSIPLNNINHLLTVIVYMVDLLIFDYYFFFFSNTIIYQ